MRRRAARPIFSAAVLTLMTAACAAPGSDAAPPHARVLRLDGRGAVKFADIVVVRAVAVSSTGKEVSAKAAAVQDGTTQLLASLLSSGFAKQGCEAVRADGEPGATRAAQWMHQIVALPEGWRFASVEAVTRDGQPSPQLRVTLEAGNE